MMLSKERLWPPPPKSPGDWVFETVNRDGKEVDEPLRQPGLTAEEEGERIYSGISPSKSSGSENLRKERLDG